MPKTRPGTKLLDETALNDLADKARSRSDWQERLDAARSWVAAFRATEAELTRERSLQGTFLHRVFVDVLGYKDQGSGGHVWTLEAEPTSDVDAKHPDGSIGFFQARTKVTRGIIELKDSLTDLDAKQLNRRDRLSPVEQAFLYLVRFEGARYALLTNFRVLRLYARNSGMTRFEEFDLRQVADPETFAQFIGVCSAEILIGSESSALSVLDRLLAGQRTRPQQEITETFYKTYSNYRDRLVRHVAQDQPDWGSAAVEHVQKLLDRILFILFAEDVGLLPPKILRQTIKNAIRSRSRRKDRAWQELKYLFEDIDKGRPDFQPAINQYNGGLFAHDEDVDEKLSIPDKLVEELRALEEYDFRTEIDVAILGHVFENSLVDIEILKREISLDPLQVERSLKAVDQQRKNYGIYYTPSWVTHFVVDQTLGRYLQESEDPQDRLRVRVLDPACGSGAFLSEALTYLSDFSRSLARAALETETGDLFNRTVGITVSSHLPQVYGIDLLPEAVEITKLSLWLKSAARSRPLAHIDTVIEGNTLTNVNASDDSEIESVIKDGGFEIVLGNPPWGANIDYPLDDTYTLNSGQFDSYELFIERTLKELIAPRGYFGFVIPDRILRPEGERLRRFLFDNYKMLTVLKLGEGIFPGVFRAAVVIVLQNTPPGNEGTYEGLIVTKDDRRELEEEGTARLATLMEQRGGAISYARVREHSSYNIVLSSDQDSQIADKMREIAAPWLGDEGIFSTYGRGEELGRNTILVQCPGCFEWSVNPRKRSQRRGGGYESKTCPDCGLTFEKDEALNEQRLVLAEYDSNDPNQVRLYSGEDVNRYFTDPPMGLRLDFQGFDYKHRELFEPPKLLIRQTSIGIYATLDETISRSLQSVYVYKVSSKERCRPEFYLAQLCSRAMLFYFFISTHQVEWQSYPKLTHTTLHQLPLRQLELSAAKDVALHDSIVELVEKRLKLAQRERHKPSEKAYQLDIEIEKLVAQVYNLEPEEISRINRRLKPLQNIRIIRELYPVEGAPHDWMV